MLIEQHQLVQKHSTEGKQLAAAQALDRHLAAPLEEIFEQAIERFDGVRTELMKETAHLDAPIGMRLLAAARSDQFAVVQHALGA